MSAPFEHDSHFYGHAPAPNVLDVFTYHVLGALSLL